MRSTPRGYLPQTSNTVHTAIVKSSGVTHTCACARRSDHYVTAHELAAGSWRDTHPTLF